MRNLRIYSVNKTLPKFKLHSLVNNIVNDLGISLSSLEINFIDSEMMLKINRKYLSHNYSTDIITFNYSDEASNIDGEIFISVDDAAENARKYKVKFIEEIGRLIVHGILHLIGYDDTSSSQKKIMKKEENRLINSYKFILLR